MDNCSLKGPVKPLIQNCRWLAVLRSSIGNILWQWSHVHLGYPLQEHIPGTRTCYVTCLYNGNQTYEKGAVVCRVAPSLYALDILKFFSRKQELKTLKNTLITLFVKISSHIGWQEQSHLYFSFFREVAEKYWIWLSMAACLGFVHGVMEYGNMSILFFTIMNLWTNTDGWKVMNEGWLPTLQTDNIALPIWQS